MDMFSNQKSEKYELERGSYDHLKPCHQPLARELAFELRSLANYQSITFEQTVESSYERIVENQFVDEQPILDV